MTRHGTSKRSWARHVLAGTVVVLAAVGGFVGAVMASLRLYPACEADFSEATIVAPDSARGRVLCSIATDGSLADDDRVLYVLTAAPVLLALVGLAVWIATRRFAWLLPVLAAALLVPWLVGGAVLSLSADCTSAQRNDHGAAGCERDEEQRPGLGQY